MIICVLAKGAAIVADLNRESILLLKEKESAEHAYQFLAGNKVVDGTERQKVINSEIRKQDKVGKKKELRRKEEADRQKKDAEEFREATRKKKAALLEKQKKEDEEKEKEEVMG